jgi:murein DD-endopeptidase MepM/ murein hydrolase activator NlpD
VSAGASNRRRLTALLAVTTVGIVLAPAWPAAAADDDVAPPLEDSPTAELPPTEARWLDPNAPAAASVAEPGAGDPVSGRTPAAARDEVAVILATIRQVESGHAYTLGPNERGASGAYQYLASTWDRHGGFAEAYLAPPEVQDERARRDVEGILAVTHGNVAMVPVIWYDPPAAGDPALMDRVPEGRDALTVRVYQRRWIETFERLRATMLPPAAVAEVGEWPTSGDAELPVSAAAITLAERSARPTLPAHGEGAMRSIAFPVLGPVTYADGWGDCRDGCARHHEGTDIIGVRMQPLLAAVDGTVTRVRHENVGKSGAVITITDADGWRYNYFHVNNDTPGSDDGAATPDWQFSPGLVVGDRVTAGQIIGYMGDSGNAEGSVPHLHFEIRDPSGAARPSYWSLRAAEARQACTIGLGPWSQPHPPADDVVDDATLVATVVPLFGGGTWQIDTLGRVTATGDAALVRPSRQLSCAAGPSVPFGTDAAGWRTDPDASVLTDTWRAPSEPGPPRPIAAAAFRDPSTGEVILVGPAA